jgi:hypothetical protein
VAWTNEEGGRFAPGCMGSMAYAGYRDAHAWDEVKDSEGLSFGAELQKHLALEADIPRRPLGVVEGVAESFWFGFKDDVVARVGPAQIDFRSVSRVGVSDLGANTARSVELRKRTETLLGAASR